ncbi:transcriptional repressor DicA [compost metagenome]
MKNTELAKKIKELRTRKGFSQDELSVAAQLNLRTIQRIESGETEPRGDTLKRLAAALQVTPNELIDWTEEEDTTVLMFLNISALSFIVFPLLGVIVPFVLWVSKKDKIKNLNATGKKLLNFQITWCILFFTLNVLYFITIMSKLKIRAFLPGLGGIETFILLIPILYGLNVIIIVINVIRSYKNRTVIYLPAIPFLR